MTPGGLWPVTYTKLARRSRWLVAVPVSLIVAGLLVVVAAGAYVLAEWTAYDRLKSRLERLAIEARYVGEPGGYLIFDERDHLLSTSPPAIREAGERFQLIHDPVWGPLAVLRLPVTTVGPHLVALPASDEVRALVAVRRTLVGMTAGGALAALVAGLLLASRALQPVDRAIRERQEFVALASHQLRTPLSIIRAAVELGRAGKGIRSEEALQTVIEQAERMESLAGRLTKFAKAESNGRSRAEAADVVAVAADVVRALQPAAVLAAVKLHIDAPPVLWVRAAPAETADMLSALLENAIKFSPRDGTVSVRIRLDRGRAVVEIADQGPGIPPEDIPHVMSPFYQGRAPRGGSGLGLAIANAVANRYGGHLAISSAPGAGTIVRVALRIHRPQRLAPHLRLVGRRILLKPPAT